MSSFTKPNPHAGTAAITKCVRVDGGALSPSDVSALLAAAWMPQQAVRAHVLRLLRSEAARLEKDHAASVAFGSHGVCLAIAALSEGTQTLEGNESAASLRARLRMAADGAAALADMVEAAGANKERCLAHGSVAALLACVEQLVGPTCPCVAPVLVAELCLQACRALGNLAYGWDVEPIKPSEWAVPNCW